MKVVFVTNGNLFHQAYLASCINKTPDVDYTCILSEPLQEAEQKARLSKQMIYDFPIIDATKDDESWKLARGLIKVADLCVVGAENHAILKGINRTYFRYSEHIFKSKFWPLSPKTYLRIPKLLFKYYQEAKKSWLLCASAHAKFDFNFYGLYRNRCLRFGYFPKANVGLNLDNKLFPRSKNEEVKILFAGRSVKFKHPDTAFYVLKKLLSYGVNCKLTFVSLPNKLRSSITQKYSCFISKGLVSVIDELQPNELMSLMATSHLFIFSSDEGEGFGATLYEAMSSKMAVIANKRAGGTDLLVSDGKNGFVYKNKRELNSIISQIAFDPTCIQRVACEAKKFVETVYNAKVAAKNLIEFVKSNYSLEFSHEEPLAKL